MGMDTVANIGEKEGAAKFEGTEKVLIDSF